MACDMPDYSNHKNRANTMSQSNRSFNTNVMSESTKDSIKVDQNRNSVKVSSRPPAKSMQQKVCRPIVTALDSIKQTFKHIIKKQILSDKDRAYIWEFLVGQGKQVLTKPQHHRLVWLKCSGAYNLMLTNPGYYDTLKQTKLDYPSAAYF